MSLETYAKKGTPISKILEHLQRNGSTTIKELERLLGITTTAVRQHLGTLQAEGYVERREVNTGVGRPHHAYIITDKAHEIFACHCDELALTLLEEVFTLEGKETATYLLERVSSRLADKYARSVHSMVAQERVEELADALNQRGVLTDVDQEDKQVVLKTYNCPFHDLAQEHHEVCEMDQNMMQKVIRTNVNLMSRIMDGHPCCSFVVSTEADSQA